MIRPLIQGSNYYYTGYTDEAGRFSFSNVRAGSYGLYAWSNGGALADVYTNFTTADVTILEGKTTNLGELLWNIPAERSRIFRVGDFDKKALGFQNGGQPYLHGVAAFSPANLTFTVGKSKTTDWYYAQSAIGTWAIRFKVSTQDIARNGNRTALLSVSLAGYSQSTALKVDVNGELMGALGKDDLASDPALYRSGKISGEWRFIQYEIGVGVLKDGWNTIGFTVTRYTQWRGFMWDSIILEWA